MVSLETPICEFDLPAINFSLPGTDGSTWTLDDCCGENGVLVMFICNHCPYVKAILERLVRDTNELKQLGVHSVAIMSNDVDDYEEDAFHNMKNIARKKNFSFPYLYDETQQTAKRYGAVCTPDFFGYNNNLQLQYRGRLDSSTKKAASVDTRRDLFEAMQQISEIGFGPKEQIPSVGCSIKWRAD